MIKQHVSPTAQPPTFSNEGDVGEPSPRSAGERAGRWFGWITGLILLFALVGITMHLTDLERFALLLRRVRPTWIFAGFLLQVGTYVFAALILRRALARYGVRQRLTSLIPLGLAKLFTDQAVPSVGLSGALLMLHSLERRGIPRWISIGAMMAGLVSYYIGYGLVVFVVLAMLWARGEITRSVLLIASVFGVVVATVPIAVLWLRGRIERYLPRLVTRLPAVREALAALSQSPTGPLTHSRLLWELTCLQLGVFLLDAGTLWVMLLALGAPTEPEIVLASFVAASVAATLGWVPGGLGTFDATCVATLHWHGVTLEVALAATLLLRGFTFWLPMVPGLWLARRELRAPGLQTDRPRNSQLPGPA